METDVATYDAVCTLLQGMIPRLTWYLLKTDGQPYVAFISQLMPAWSFYIKKAVDFCWYVEWQPDDVTVIMISGPHPTAMAAAWDTAKGLLENTFLSLPAAVTATAKQVS